MDSILKFPGIVDMTKAPYYCDNTGEQDCTEKICKAIDDILRPNIDNVDKAIAKLNESEDPNYRISFEICKKNGVLNVIFPEDLENAKILYFRKGTYLVSDTLSHSLEKLKNILNGVYTMEINRQIYIYGENEKETIIKLKDNCKGYEFGNRKPVVSFIRTQRSNIAQTNAIANITIDCGSGNGGAVGLKFYSNNSGSVRNVTIKSSDSEFKGYSGLLLDIPMEGYVKNLTVDGFDYGVRVERSVCPVVFENVVVKNQLIKGFNSIDSNVSILNFKSQNNVTAYRSEGADALGVLINAECSGGNELYGGVELASGEAYIRNVQMRGYKWPLIKGIHCYDPKEYIEEYCTSVKRYNLFSNDRLSLNLNIESAPEDYEPECVDDIALVDDYGARGDGKTDSTLAIQAAMDSGKPYIMFGCGHYLVNDTVTISKSVRTIDFMYCDFYSGKNLTEAVGRGFFKIDESSDIHLSMKRVFSWEKFYGKFRFIEHAAKRNLVMRDLHTQCAGMYFNTVEGSKVYIENCACTMGGDEYCTVSPFEFVGQEVWCRNINPERGDIQILNDHSKLWIFGMKTETHVGRFASVAVKNINGGKTEIFGAQSGIGGHDIPLYINNESDMSAYFTSSGPSEKAKWNILVRETQNGVSRELLFDDAHEITWYRCRVAGYVGISKTED